MVNRIEISGNIASGKTTLAQLIAQTGRHVIFEKFQENPFWRDFYKDQNKYSFETELSFHLQHYHDIKVNIEKSSKLTCDYSLLLDRAYADVTLDKNKRDIFTTVSDEIESEIGLAETMIYLKCPDKVLLDRIRERNRAVEMGITIEYLQLLSKSITARIEKYRELGTVIDIDSHKINFSDSEEGIAEVLDILDIK